MSEQPEPTPAPPPPHALQFGLASVLLGAVVFLAAPVVVLVAAHIYQGGRTYPDVAQVRVWLARIAVAGPFLIALFGAWLGVRGLQMYRVEGTSFALPAAGLALCAIAFLGWGIACYALLWTVETLS